MRTVARIGWRLLQTLAILLALVIVAVAVLGAVSTTRGFAQTTGTITVPALHQPVTVARDAAGIIQLTADDPHDLFVAQGYTHAQERMWQMEISRRIGAGRLSELFGKSQLDTDRYIRTLGWRVSAARDLDAMSAESRAVLQAYADGVNAWIDEHDGRLATPFVVSGLLAGSPNVGGYDLEPWTPLDTATWQKVQAWSLGGNADAEIFRLLADAKLGDSALTDELFPAYDDSAPVITPAGLEGSGGASAPKGSPARPARPVASVGPTAQLSASHASALADLARMGSSVTGLAGFDQGPGMLGSHGIGSNNWVVSGEHTASGKPILANDPHLGFAMPGIWIMNGLHCRNVGADCPWDVVGVSFPGAPAVIVGHNARIAWGATNVGPDTQDLFVETVDPADPAHYLFQGKSVPFGIRHETIKVAGGPDVAVDVRSTGHGVVLSDVDDRLKDGPVLSLRWTTTAEVDRALETFFKIDVAASFADYYDAFDGYGSPSQNFIYADVDGHIGYVLPGLIPIRTGAQTGDRVRDGASGTDEWTGYVPREDLPWQLDPAGGRINSSNNAPVSASYPHFLGSDWDPGYRAQRVLQRLDAGPPKATTEDMRSIQLDTYVLRADNVMRLLQAINPQPVTADGRLLWDRMVAWDRHCDVDSLGCAAYITAELMLQRAIFDDDLGDVARDYVGTSESWEGMIEVLSGRAYRWWGSVKATGTAPDPAVVAGPAIDEAARQLREAYGDPAGWTWGRLHTVAFREATLGSSGIPPLEWYFDPPAQPVAGADGAVNNTYYRIDRAYPDPNDPGYVPVGFDKLFHVTNGPSFRFTVDMGDLDGATLIVTTGQSGNPFDSHYGDLISKWVAGETLPLPFSPANVAANTVQTLTLSPP